MVNIVVLMVGLKLFGVLTYDWWEVAEFLGIWLLVNFFLVTIAKAAKKGFDK